MNAAIEQMFGQLKDLSCDEAQEWMTWLEESGFSLFEFLLFQVLFLINSF